MFFTLNPWEKSRKKYKKKSLHVEFIFNSCGVFFPSFPFTLTGDIIFHLTCLDSVNWFLLSEWTTSDIFSKTRIFESHPYVTFLLGEISFWLTSDATFMLKNLASYSPNPEISPKSILNVCAHIYAYKDMHTYIYMNTYTKINLGIFYISVASITTNIQTSL